MDGKEIRIQQIWSVEQEILDVIHQICVQNDLRYCLAYGTLLGAVRHEGFIPWDDDIDIIMPREDYERLGKIWTSVAPSGYIFQDYHTDWDYTNNFAKIRKDGTTFLQDAHECSKEYHKGVFVDIFPGDRVAPNGMLRKLQYVAFAINLLYSREYGSGAGGIIGLVEKFFLKLPKKWHKRIRDGAESFMRKWEGNKDCQFVFPSRIVCTKRYYPSDTFETMQAVTFEGKKYFASDKTDQILHIEYGDYMQLPPEEERVWKHHPLLVDFDHNYEELLL